jgi:hypothetical protein
LQLAHHSCRQMCCEHTPVFFHKCSERHIYLQFNATEKNKPIPTISGLERKVRSFILSR